MPFYGRWAPYVPVAHRRGNGLRETLSRLKKGEKPEPVHISGRKISETFWGQNWCKHFEQYRDFDNRLPRGRTYARNGSISHLKISSGNIKAFVCGSSLYQVKIKITPLPQPKWTRLIGRCGQSITSVIDLMRGKLSHDVIRTLTDPDDGLFPTGPEMSMTCDCPDYADLCKHLAAVLYGVGNRLDQQPDLLFLLRGVDQNDLIAQVISAGEATDQVGLDGPSSFDDMDLGEIFGIEMATTS